MNEQTSAGNGARESEYAGIEDRKPKTQNRPSTRNGWISGATLLLGTCVVVFLTRYNLSLYTAWSSGPNRPYRTWEEYLVVNTTGLLLLPFLLIFGAFREEAAEFGFRLPRPEATRIAWLLFLAMLPVLLVASRFPDFQNYYPIQKQAAVDGGYLVYFELTYGFYMFCWEFFYRGFLLFGLARALGGPAAIGIQAFAFGTMHYGKPTSELFSSFIAGVALGWLALRGRSFLPCFAVHWAVSITFDLLVIWAAPGGIF